MRRALEADGVHIEDVSEPVENSLVANYYIDDKSWTTFLFIKEDAAVVDMYSVLDLQLAQYDRLHLFEVINYTNFRFLYRSHFEISPSADFIRLREMFIGSGTLINPVEFISTYRFHQGQAAAWSAMFSDALSSAPPASEAVQAAWTSWMQSEANASDS